MTKSLVKFWFDSFFGIGIGVTAFDLQDAIDLVKTEKAAMRCRPDFESHTENIDVVQSVNGFSSPMFDASTVRGIWFPLPIEPFADL